MECLPTSEGKGESCWAEGFGDDAACRWEACSCMRFAEEAYARETDFALLFDLLLDDRLRPARLLHAVGCEPCHDGDIACDLLLPFAQEGAVEVIAVVHHRDDEVDEPFTTPRLGILKHGLVGRPAMRATEVCDLT